MKPSKLLTRKAELKMKLHQNQDKSKPTSIQTQVIPKSIPSHQDEVKSKSSPPRRQVKKMLKGRTKSSVDSEFCS